MTEIDYNYWQKQDSFQIKAMRQALIEFLRKWQKDYNFTQRPGFKEATEYRLNCEYLEDGHRSAEVVEKEDLMFVYVPAQAHNGTYLGSLRYTLEPSICFLKEDEEQRFYFRGLEVTGGDNAIQGLLDVRKAIEKRVKEIEKETK